MFDISCSGSRAELLAARRQQHSIFTENAKGIQEENGIGQFGRLQSWDCGSVVVQIPNPKSQIPNPKSEIRGYSLFASATFLSRAGSLVEWISSVERPALGAGDSGRTMVITVPSP